ncbi:IS1096 element passenger TnpR family protein [Mesorhizobium caraganae]|uniref:IS1096 element passenger TnpR family protein n=1 Tax=Mesorhizobium caraganae TaxID=483206 RepID=UPI00333963FE
MLLEATGCCPPEDIGGPWSYPEFREACVDPTHEGHAELIEWWGSKITIRNRPTSPSSTKLSTTWPQSELANHAEIRKYIRYRSLTA